MPAPISSCALKGATVGPGEHPSPCLGLCERAPAKYRTVAGEAPFEEQLPAESPPLPQREGLRLLRRIADGVDPTSLDAYVAAGGFEALARARELGPDAVIAEVTASKLLGRGGAAFPTGTKWRAVRDQVEQTRYVVCNADESEPGTFKDRVLMESDPFALVEALDDRRLRDRRAEGLRLHPRRVPARARARAARDRRDGGVPRRLRDRAPHRRGCVRVRRGDRALPVDRGQARRAAQQAAVPGAGRPVRQADRGQQRRDALQRARGACASAAPSTPRPAPKGRRAPGSSASPAASSGRGSTSCRSARRCASCSSSRAPAP